VSVYRHRNIVINTKKMTITWKKGDHIVDPHMIKHFKAIWREGDKVKYVPFPFVVDNFVLKINGDDYKVKE